MEEVFGLKGDGHAWHRDVIVVTGTVADIGANSKRDWFGLPGGKERMERGQLKGPQKAVTTKMEVLKLSRAGEQ